MNTKLNSVRFRLVALHGAVHVSRASDADTYCFLTSKALMRAWKSIEKAEPALKYHAYALGNDLGTNFFLQVK